MTGLKSVPPVADKGTMLAAIRSGQSHWYEHPAGWLTLPLLVIMVWAFDRLRWWSAKRGAGGDAEARALAARGELPGPSRSAVRLAAAVMLTIAFGLYFALNALVPTW